jgi:hypothetical protein
MLYRAQRILRWVTYEELSESYPREWVELPGVAVGSVDVGGKAAATGGEVAVDVGEGGARYKVGDSRRSRVVAVERGRSTAGGLLVLLASGRGVGRMAAVRGRRRARCRDRALQLLRLVSSLELSRTLDIVGEAGWTRCVRRGAVPLGCEEANHEVTHGRE